MSPLGDLLALMHQAPRRYATVRLESREWRHGPRFARVMERAVASSGGTPMAFHTR